MSEKNYKIKPASDRKWGIYQNEQLLATIGSYDVCESIWRGLQQRLSNCDNIRSRISNRNALD